MVNDLATAIPVTPNQAMAGVLSLAAGKLQYVNDRVANLKDDELFVPREYDKSSGTFIYRKHYWLAYQDELMIQCARISKMAVDAGVSQRFADIAEQHARALTQLLDAVADDVGLTIEQKKLIGPAILKRQGEIFDSGLKT